MFAYSSYSPLFTMGLLAEHSPAPTSPPASSHRSDDASAIYFTLQSSKRDSLELRSFLYLDLADHKLHTPSHRRKPSALSKSTSCICSADVKSVYDFARSEKPMIMSPAPVVATRRRTSKESLRSIPSPKPAPSATLPDLPPTPTLSSASSEKRPTPRRPASLRSASVTSSARRRSHMDALACLEGRSQAPNRVPRSSSLRNNFMSFSDDEDEQSLMRTSSTPKLPVVQAEDVSAFADVEDEADAVVPKAPRKHEAVDQAKPARPARPARKRRSTIESWFPLKSFMDLKDDDLSSWNWRSFIEIGGVA